MPGIRVWKDRHQAWWKLPDPAHITAALRLALSSARKGEARRVKAAEWGRQFDADLIVADCWVPWLKEAEAAL